MNLSDMSGSELYENAFHKLEERSFRRFLAIWAVVLILFIALRLTFTYYYGGIYVAGTSMCDTLSDGDFLYVNKHIEARRGDIIVIDVSPYREKDGFSNNLIIKRLIATEGDSLYGRDGKIYIRYSGSEEFIRLEEDYISSSNHSFPLTEVGEGEIFFLGDNRAVSKDSSLVGCYKTLDIYGVVAKWSMNNKSILTFIFRNIF